MRYVFVLLVVLAVVAGCTGQSYYTGENMPGMPEGEDMPGDEGMPEEYMPDPGMPEEDIPEIVDPYQPLPPIDEIKATSCDGDNICEMKAALADTIKVGSAANNLPALYVNVMSSPSTGSEVWVSSPSTFKDIVVMESGLTAAALKVGLTSESQPALYVYKHSTGYGMQVNSEANFRENVVMDSALTASALKVGIAANSNPALYVNQIGSAYEVQVNSEATFVDNVVMDMGLTAQALKVGRTPEQLPALYVNEMGSSIDGSTVRVNSESTFGDDVEIEGDVSARRVTVDNLVGDGDAYVCVDEDGMLFRSDDPCV